MTGDRSGSVAGPYTNMGFRSGGDSENLKRDIGGAGSDAGGRLFGPWTAMQEDAWRLFGRLHSNCFLQEERYSCGCIIGCGCRCDQELAVPGAF